MGELSEAGDIHALAKCIHEARFNGPVTTPWEEELEGGKIYCYRIANAVDLHLLATRADQPSVGEGVDALDASR